MKKMILGSLMLLFSGNTAWAGGLLTNTNQSATFGRMMARGASHDLDATYYNPAGLAFMAQDGFFLSLGIQSAQQERNIDATFPLFDTPDHSKYFKGKASAPIIPSLDAIYKKDNWTLSAHFAVGGGGGKCSFDDGLPMFESLVRAGMAQQVGTPGSQLNKVATAMGIANPNDIYGLNSAMDGRQYIYQVQGGVTYKFTDWLSGFAGVRMNYFTGGYKGYVTATMKPAIAQAVGLTGDQAKLVDLQLDCDQTGWGVNPILGLNVKYKNLTLAAKYEFKTRLNLENDTHKLEDGGTGALNQFKDGVNTPSDVPALLTAAVGYEFLPGLRATAEYHHFYDKQAGMADNKQQHLTRGTNEYLFGAEWDFAKKWTVSAGGQITDYGLSDRFQSDTSFSCDSYSIGFGGAYRFNDHLRVQASYFWTTYSDYTLKSDNYNGTTLAGTNVYSRTNKVFGVQLDYKF